MKLVPPLLIAGMGLTVLVTPAAAADYFIQAQTPGPVTGSALNAISLQATTEKPKAEQDSLRTRSAIAVSPAKAKWTRARKEGETSAGTSDVPFGTGGETTTVGGTTSGGEPGFGGEPTSGGTTEISGGTIETAGGTTETSGGTTETPSGTTETSGGTTTEGAGTTEGSTSGSTTDTSGGTTASTGGATGNSVVAPTPINVSGPAPTISASQTYRSFDALAQSNKLTGGDRVFFLDGYHGPLVVKGMKFTSPVLFAAMPGQVAHVDGISVRSSSKIIFQGLKVWPTAAQPGPSPLVRSMADSSDLVFQDLDVRSVANAANYVSWTVTDWGNNKRDAFLIDGARQSVIGNRATGIFNGVQITGTGSYVESNIVDGFSGDGLRALGNNSIVRRNKVQNCAQTSASHLDGFQSWSRGSDGRPGTGTVRNLTIEDNKIFEWVSPQVSPLRCQLQGISMFDGMFDGVIVRNNVVATSRYHGITINGALNSKIVNNTVVNITGQKTNYPWIMLSPHKNGTPSKNVDVANNLAMDIRVKPNPSLGHTVLNNVIPGSIFNDFTAPGNQDYTLKSGSSAIDRGAAAYAPKDDLTGAARPKGKAPDAGAYESF